MPTPEPPNPSSAQSITYSRQQASARLNISLRTLDKLINDRQIQISKLGSRILITEQAILDLLAKTSVPAFDASAVAKSILKPKH